MHPDTSIVVAAAADFPDKGFSLWDASTLIAETEYKLTAVLGFAGAFKLTFSSLPEEFALRFVGGGKLGAAAGGGATGATHFTGFDGLLGAPAPAPFVATTATVYVSSAVQ